MTEKELSELYARLALQFDSVLGTLVSKSLVFPDFVPGIRKDFYDSLNKEKRKDFERISTYTEIIRRYIRENADNGPISLTQLAKEYSEESPGYVIQSWMRSKNTLEFLRQWEMAENPNFERIAQVKAELIRVKEELKPLEAAIQNIPVTVSDLAKVIELSTGIPANKVAEDDYQKIIHLEEQLNRRIIGQPEAVNQVVRAIKRSRLQLSTKKRPASFIFVGPTGVGKTELVKVLSAALFDSVDPVLRFDMSEFMEKHTVARLIGAPPGYVGYDEAGQLTEKVRRRPYSVVLFDEIEKAHPDVMNILLQILDEGRISDAQGREVNFENTVIVMTSNAGSGEKSALVGFNRTANEIDKEKAMNALSMFLRPEFLGRVDEVIVFNRLTLDDLAEISGILLEELAQALKEKNIRLCYDDHAKRKIAELAGGGKYNARDLRKVIRHEVEDPIAQYLIDHFADRVEAISVTADDALRLTFM